MAEFESHSSIVVLHQHPALVRGRWEFPTRAVDHERFETFVRNELTASTFVERWLDHGTSRFEMTYGALGAWPYDLRRRVQKMNRLFDHVFTEVPDTFARRLSCNCTVGITDATCPHEISHCHELLREDFARAVAGVGLTGWQRIGTNGRSRGFTAEPPG